jgi:zinc protease
MIRLFRLLASMALVAAGFAPTTGIAQTAAAGVTRVVAVEGATEYRLANGLRVVLYPDASKPTVTVNITYLVGSRHENYGETGMAHLLEHLIFKGSKKYPHPDKEFTRRGFRNNGSTWFDRTNYFSTFQASDDNLRWALGWKADAMVNSFIAKKDLDSEMTVVRNEYENGENQPVQVLFKRALSLMFDWHNYGNSTIGNRSDIENVRIENLQRFYRTYYQPDNAVLVVAGKFDEGRTLRWIGETFGRIPRPKRELPPLWTVEPTQDGERTFAVRRKGDMQAVLLGYRVPSALHPDIDALGVAAEVLGNTPNGRLHKELVEKGLAAQVFTYIPQTRDAGLLMIGAIVKPGDSLDKARDRMIEVVESTLVAAPPTDAELQRVRADNETAVERTLASPTDFGVTLSEYVAVGDWRLFFLARDRVQQVTGAEAAAAAARYLRRDNRTVGVFIPEDAPQRAEIPASPPLAERLREFKPREAVAAGEAFDPSQDNIDRRTRRTSFGDLKLALLPKKTRGATVNAVLSFRWGDEKNLSGQSINQMLSQMMVMRGTNRLTRRQIADEMTRLKMTGDVRSFQTVRTNLPDALRLSAHVLRDASFPPEEFELLRRELLTGLQAQLNDPAERSRDALLAHFNTYPPGDPRHYLPLARRIEAIQAATLDDVKRFHADFWGTARGEIAIVGDFDAPGAEALVRQLFTPWVSKAAFGYVLSEPRDVAAARLVVDTPDKENALLRARQALVLRDDDADFPALMVASTVFGEGGGLSNRLINRLRQKDGVSYSAGSALLVGSRDRAAAFQLGALVAPQNAARAEAAIREEFALLVRDGLTDRELADAKNGLLQERLVNRSQDAVVAAGWITNLDRGRTYAFSKSIEDRIRALTAAEVNAAIRRHFDPAKMTFVIAGDAKKGVR